MVNTVDPTQALTRGQGGGIYMESLPDPFRGPPTLILSPGPYLLQAICIWNVTGVWVGEGPVRQQGQGMQKRPAGHGPLSGARWENVPGACSVANAIYTTDDLDTDVQ